MASPGRWEFEPSSLVDPVGRVFHSEGRVYRAIYAPHGAFVRSLLRRAEARGWFEAGLVPTWATDLQIDGFELVIEHRKIPFVTLRGEWPGEGLRAAAVLILRLQAALLRDGMCLKDAHPWNVLFEGTRPWFVDWGSVRPANELSWDFWYAQFRQFILAPLCLFASGRHRMARTMLREHNVGLGNEVLERPAFRRFPRAAADIARGVGPKPIDEVVDALADHVAAMPMPPVPGEWEKYDQPAYAGRESLEGMRLKDRIVHGILERDPGRTVFDIGTNNGLHADLAAALGKTVLACDIEETCLNRLYLRSREAQRPILPLYHDFLWPIGESGLLNSIASSAERMRCDTALAMAITHHLILRRLVSFEAIARGLHQLCGRRLVVEFVPADDVHVATWSGTHPDWYRLEGFTSALGRYFGSITVVDSEPHPRKILVCQDAAPH